MTSPPSSEKDRMSLDELEIPPAKVVALSCQHILDELSGHALSVELGAAVDAEGEPLPNYTYPTIEYLRQLDFSDRVVFEYGSGNSTVYWSRVAQRVHAVEHNQTWYHSLKAQWGTRFELILRPAEAYAQAIHEIDAPFDVIIVDGIDRYDCAAQAVPKLKPGGMIILDNSDWHYQTAAMLRQSGLIEVDMTGFKPGMPRTYTTSLFLHRQFDFKPVSDRQPVGGIGSIKMQSGWDEPKTG